MVDILLVFFRDPIIAEVAQDVLGRWCELLSPRFTGFRVDADFMIPGV